MTGGPTLVVGATGLVGQRVLAGCGGSVVGTYRTRAAAGLVHLDITRRDEVMALVRELRASVIICTAAISSVERCEENPALTRRVNVVGTRHLVDTAASVGALLVYFSSEYVFDGVRGPYSEEDAVNPINEYGRQKAEAEDAIRRSLGRHLIVRTSGVYDWEPPGKNFVMQLLSLAARGEPMLVPNDQIITPTYATNLGQAVKELVDTGAVGTFHVAGTVPMNRAEFAYLVAEVFELDASLIVPMPTRELGLHAPRPRSAGLSVARAEALLRTPLVSPRQGLLMMRRTGVAKIGSAPPHGV